MTQPRPVRNTHTVAGRLALTPDAQRLLVAEAMAQVRPEGEQARTGVLGGIEAYYSPTQKQWYDKELGRTLRAARKAAQAPVPVPSPLAAPERHEQVQQRHYAQEVEQQVPLPAADGLLVPFYAIGGEDGAYLPAAPDQCLTRDAARAVADEENEDRDLTLVNPILMLAIRTQTRLLERGVGPRVAALVANELITDVEHLLQDNALDGMVNCVHVAQFEGGEWVAQDWPSSSWADRPLWSSTPDGPHAQPEQQQAQLAREIETGYPEAGYQTLAEGLRRLAAGREALPAPLTAETAPGVLALPTDRVANDALFEASADRVRDLEREWVQATAQGDHERVLALHAAAGREHEYQAALTALLPGGDWLEVGA